MNGGRWRLHVNRPHTHTPALLAPIIIRTHQHMPSLHPVHYKNTSPLCFACFTRFIFMPCFYPAVSTHMVFHTVTHLTVNSCAANILCSLNRKLPLHGGKPSDTPAVPIHGTPTPPHTQQYCESSCLPTRTHNTRDSSLLPVHASQFVRRE